MKEIRIDEKFRTTCPSLSSEELIKLEELIIKDGIVYNPILLWNNAIIDGHNRYDIAKRNGIEFTTKEISFESDEDAIAWIKENAISQRNLNDYQRSRLALELEDYYKAKAKERLKTSTGGSNPQPVPTLAHPEEKGKVRDELAKKAGVSHGTIDKVRYIDHNAIQEIKDQLEKGEVSISKAFNDITYAKSEMAPEIDILESAANSLERWTDRYSDKECCFEFVPIIRDLIVSIKNKKIDYAKTEE